MRGLLARFLLIVVISALGVKKTAALGKEEEYQE